MHYSGNDLTRQVLGPQMNIDEVRIIRQDGRNMTVGMYLAPVFWDSGTDLQILMRTT